MTKGYLTTEFWTTLAKTALALLITLGVVSASDASTVEGAVTNIITAVFALATNAWVIVEYIKSRTAVKMNNSQVQAALTYQTTNKGGGDPSTR